VRRAKKIGSYEASGTIVSEFKTLDGATRYVFEFDEPRGMLHIFGESNLIIEEDADETKNN
jgi:hypothetical protein